MERDCNKASVDIEKPVKDGCGQQASEMVTGSGTVAVEMMIIGWIKDKS